jgi:hypothetical protein
MKIKFIVLGDHRVRKDEIVCYYIDRCSPPTLLLRLKRGDVIRIQDGDRSIIERYLTNLDNAFLRNLYE